MGLDIFIHGRNYNKIQRNRISRHFFALANEYDVDQDNSLLAQLSTLFSLDLTFYGNFHFDEIDEPTDEFDENDLDEDDDEENEDDNLQVSPWIETTEAIARTQLFLAKIKDNPNFFELLDYDEVTVGFDNINDFAEYALTGLSPDLEEVLNVLYAYKERGVIEIYFSFG